MNTLDELLSAVINGQHGWAVGEQFEETWNGQSAEDQNPNAMELIINTLEDMVNGELLSDWAQRDTLTYLNRIKEEMSGQDEEEDEEDEEEEEPTDDNQNLQEQELSEIGFGYAGMAQTSNNSTSQSTTTNTTQQGLPSDIGGVEGVKKFQDWLDKTKGEWAFSKTYNKNYKVNQNPKLGYGVFGPNTNKMWNDQTVKDEYMKGTIQEQILINFKRFL